MIGNQTYHKPLWSKVNSSKAEASILQKSFLINVVIIMPKIFPAWKCTKLCVANKLLCSMVYLHQLITQVSESLRKIILCGFRYFTLKWCLQCCSAVLFCHYLLSAICLWRFISISQCELTIDFVPKSLLREFKKLWWKWEI